jgi:hypothetical protein
MGLSGRNYFWTDMENEILRQASVSMTATETHNSGKLPGRSVSAIFCHQSELKLVGSHLAS